MPPAGARAHRKKTARCTQLVANAVVATWQVFDREVSVFEGMLNRTRAVWLRLRSCVCTGMSDGNWETLFRTLLDVYAELFTKLKAWVEDMHRMSYNNRMHVSELVYHQGPESEGGFRSE